MRISELIAEQNIVPSGTIGTSGTTTASPGKIPPISQAPATTAAGSDPNSPSNKPVGTTAPATATANPNMQKLAATLKQNKIANNDVDVNNFVSAYTAKANNKTLTPAQSTMMANLAGSLLKNKDLGKNLDLQIKAMSAQTPGTATNTIGQQPRMQQNIQTTPGRI